MRLSYLALIFLCLLSFSCSNSSAPTVVDRADSHRSDEDVKKLEENALNLLEAAERSLRVECEDSSRCPENVGLVVATDGKSTWRCTGVLLDQETLITAGHCLPKELNKLDQSCQNQLRFYLPSSQGQPSEVLSCDRLIGLNPWPWRPYDYAALKLAQKSERSINTRVSQREHFHGLPVTLWMAQTQEHDLVSIRSTQCQLNSKSLLSLYFDSPRSPLVQYAGCLTQSGTSGAPVFNPHNEVIAIHGASTKTTSAVTQGLAQFAASRSIQEVAQATNLGCLCRTGEHFLPCTDRPQCMQLYDEEQLYQNRIAILDRVIAPYNSLRAFGALDELRDQLQDSPFEWHLGLSFHEAPRLGAAHQYSFYLTLKPRCLKDNMAVQDLPWISWGGVRRLESRQHRLCQTHIGLNSKLEVESVLPPQVDHCVDVTLEMSLTQSDYLDLKLRFLNTSRPPFEEVVSIPRCRP